MIELVVSLFRTSCGVTAFAGALAMTGCQAGPVVRSADFDRLTGPPWTGTLTYRDYTTDRQTSIDSTLEVIKLPGLAAVGNEFADAGVTPRWEFRFGYPREPKANSTSEIRIEDGGRRLGDETVTERVESSDGSLRLVTEEDGSDNDRPARFRHQYVFAEASFTMTKLVKPTGADSFFERHTYRWTR